MMVCVVSTEKRFSEMLVNELNAAGIPAERYESFLKKNASSLTVADLDSCGRLPQNYKYIIGYSRGKRSDGADACAELLHRPFPIAGLCERLKALSETLSDSVNVREDAAEERLKLNPENFSCTLGDGEILLTPSEYTVLSVLVGSAGQSVSVEELRNAVGGGDGNTVQVYICGIRKKLAEISGARIIRTVRGKGYSI